MSGSARTIIIEDFTPVAKNSLIGFARIALPSGMIINDVGIHRSGSSAWASPPSKPMISREGFALKDVAGQARYVSVVSFASKEARDRFSQGVIDAMRASHPGSLG